MASKALMELADEELMQLVRRGDPRAFEVVYDRPSGAAFSLAYRMTGKRTTAEDVVQEAFLALWRANARYDRTRGSVRPGILGTLPHPRIAAAPPGRAAARGGGVAHARRGAGDGDMEERFAAEERTEVGVPRRDEAREVR